MSTKEKETRFREAVRYMDNASNILRTRARKRDRFYEDEKYVRMACATAYNAVLLAVDTYLEMKDRVIRKKKDSRKSVDDYRKELAVVDSKLLKEFNSAYRVLHLEGYYEGETKYDTIQSGMDSAIQIINKIKPIGLESYKQN